MSSRGFSILMLLVIGLHLAGFYGYLAVRLPQIRREMLTRLQETQPEHLQRIQLTEAAFRKSLVGDDEMKIDGKMYDIAYIERSAGSVIIFGLHDEKEGDLLEMISAILENSSNDKKPVPISLLSLNTLSAIVPLPLQVEFGTDTNCSFTGWKPPVSDFLTSITTPPPRG